MLDFLLQTPPTHSFIRITNNKKVIKCFIAGKQANKPFPQQTYS